MAETNWYKWDEDKQAYVFNHRAHDDQMCLDAPPPRSDKQRKAWAGARWYKELVREGQSP